MLTSSRPPVMPAARALLLGELRDQQRQRPEDAADQREIEAKEQAIAQAEVGVDARAAGIGQQPDQQAHRQQRRPHGGQLLQRHPRAPLRQREQGVQRCRAPPRRAACGCATRIGQRAITRIVNPYFQVA